ncbi:MAG: hypothetical protein IKW49_08970 [Opitutales bacterium]|nr:hypothetical protein [Opitutales bacterium]
MGSKLEAIEKILHPACVPENQGCLLEVKPDGEVWLPVKFKSRGGQYKVVRFWETTEKKPLLPFFRPDVPGLLRLCDYIVFVEERETLFVFVLELKKPKGKANEAKKQLLAGKLLAEFIVKSAGRIGLLDVNSVHPVKMIHFSERKVEVTKEKKKNLRKLKKQNFAVCSCKKETRISKPVFEDGFMDYVVSKTLLLDCLIDAARSEGD